MPRNPDKAYCTMPLCKNWAMRGHERCRWHTNGSPSIREGARGPGAPLGNLNALKHGTSANPLSERSGDPELQGTSAKLEEPIAAILAGSDDLPYHLGLRSTAEIPRCEGRRPLSKQSGGDALLALRRLLAQVIPAVAGQLFSAELRDLLQPLPPQARDRTVAQIERLAAHRRTEDLLLHLRKIKTYRKQLPVLAQHPERSRREGPDEP